MYTKKKHLCGGLRWRLPVARLGLCLIVVVVMAGVFPMPIQAAGLYTHTWFVEQAIQRLAAHGGYDELVGILNRHLATIGYGALFPDITMTNDADWAEIAHDTGTVRDNNYSKYLVFLTGKGYDKYNSDLQTAYYKEFLKDPAYGASVTGFRAALIAQMLGRFKNSPRSQDDEKMLAFLFGVIAHQEADAFWHWDYPACNDMNFGGIGWGLECAAWKDKDYWDSLTREVQLDQILYHYDVPEHTVDFGFLPTVHPVIYAAVDAAGIRRPAYTWTCFTTTDPLWCGEGRMEAAWGVATTDLGANDGMKGFLTDFVPGGTKYGSALAAAAWMHTWDQMKRATYHYIYLPSFVR